MPIDFVHSALLTAAPVAEDIVDPTAAHALLASFGEAWRDVRGLEAREIALNLGLSAAVIVGSVLLLLVLRSWLRIGFERLAARTLSDEAKRPGATRLSWTVVKLGAAIAALVLVLRIWGVHALDWLAGDGEVVGRVLFGVVATAFCAELSGGLIDRSFNRSARRTPEPRRRAQLRTLAPLVGGLAQGAVVIVGAIMILGEVGVRVGPLLAGAGVVGIAVGFGAQTLVKDFLTGMFLVIEDIVAVGDIVRVGDSSGSVEQMTLRTIRLRDFDGTLHVFPYSEAQVIHNLTKTFSYYVFDLQVSYGSDIDRALEIMRQVGMEMQAEPEYAEEILEPIEVVGVDGLAASGVVLKARVKTQPSAQWRVGREYNRRIKLAFEQAGIEIPFPHLKLVLPEGGDPAPTGKAAA